MSKNRDTESIAVDALRDVLREYMSDPFSATVNDYVDKSGKVDLAALRAADRDAEQRNDEFYRRAVRAVFAAVVKTREKRCSNCGEELFSVAGVLYSKGDGIGTEFCRTLHRDRSEYVMDERDIRDD